MAPERDTGVKNKYPCTSLFFTLYFRNPRQIMYWLPSFFHCKNCLGPFFFCTCPSVYRLMTQSLRFVTPMAEQIALQAIFSHNWAKSYFNESQPAGHWVLRMCIMAVAICSSMGATNLNFRVSTDFSLLTISRSGKKIAVQTFSNHKKGNSTPHTRCVSYHLTRKVLIRSLEMTITSFCLWSLFYFRGVHGKAPVDPSCWLPWLEIETKEAIKV